MKKILYCFILINFFLSVMFVSQINASYTSDDPYSEGLVYSEFLAIGYIFIQDDHYAYGNSNDRYNMNDVFEFDFDMPFGYSITGIGVYIDCYNPSETTTLDIRLTNDGGSHWSDPITSPSLPSSDTDYYTPIGGSSEDWGMSWDITDFDDPEDFLVLIIIKSSSWTYIDHTVVTLFYDAWEQPEGEEFGSGETDSYDSNCSCIDLVFYPEVSACWYMLSWPCCYSIMASDFVDLFNNTDCVNSVAMWIPEEQTYYAWINGAPFDFEIVKFQGVFVSINSNVTICYPMCEEYNITLYENIGYALGTHEYILNETGYHVWANYSSYIILFENIVNATGTHDYIYSDYMGGTWFIWANYSGNITECPECNSTNITLHENIINAIGTHQYIYNPLTGFDVWANYTGDCGDECTKRFLNYSDDNVTINITYWGCNNTNTTTGYVNENNWLNLAGTLLFDNAQIFLLLLVALWTYFLGKYYDTRLEIFSYVQLAFAIPLCISIALLSLSFMFGFIIVFIIPIFGIYVFYDGIMYGRK